MLSSEKLFGNLFNDPEITTTRLANFALDALNKLTAGNTKGIFDSLIALLTPLVQQLQAQVGSVDTSLAQQKGTTLTNDEVMAQFIETMRTQEGVIANAVGGFKSAGYLQFYPHGLN